MKNLASIVLGLIALGQANAAVPVPKVSCNLAWSFPGEDVKDSGFFDVAPGKRTPVSVKGFELSAILEPQFKGTKLVVYRLALDLTHRDVTARRSDVPVEGSSQSLTLDIGQETAVVSCDVSKPN